MIKKVAKIDLVPADLQELLLPETGEYVAIGHNIYEMFPFPVEQYLKLLGFMGKYFNTYNDIFKTDNPDEPKKNLSNTEFFGELAKSLIRNNILDEFFSLFPDIEEDLKNITIDQLTYLLGIIYKLNFLSKKKPIVNLQTQAAMQKMMAMLGLTFLNQN